MKKIKINAKSAPEMEQILAKVNVGFKNLELQLVHEFVSENEYRDVKKAIEEYGIDISVVHTPLIAVEGEKLLEETSLEHILQDKYYEIFCDTCKFSQYIADMKKHRIKIVIHNTLSSEEWRITNLIEEKIATKIKKVLDKYKDLDLVVENSTCVGEKTFKSILGMEDVSFAVKELNKIIGDRSKTLLDTCHMMINWEAWKRVTYNDLTDWDNAFYKSTTYEKLGLIHLNNMRDNGLNKENHGTSFEKNLESDLETLKQIMSAYEKFADCEITIEVREKDYKGIPTNLIKTKEALEYLGYKLDLGVFKKGI